ncbi:RNA-processing protein [Candidatus Woesearchaeota archaeon]|nr:RNA-processing protein [Candidatus Woesearchaeota archaeon]
MAEIKIPKARVAVLLGVKGKTKRRIEIITNTKLKINSKEGEVEISGEPFEVYQAEPILKAIARGFNPDTALCLGYEENCFELIDIKHYSGNSKKKFSRMKSRLIGAKGKCRKTIEQIAGVKLSIYGKTVGIIGKIEDVHLARIAVLDILNGAPHGPVYKNLEERVSKLEQK